MSFARIVATWFGAGLVPKAPGTAGSLAAIPLYLLLLRFGGPLAHLIATLVVTVVGIWAAGRVEVETGTKDPQIVVVDEVAGMLIALLPGPPSFATIAVAFVAFRVFDSTKPWPVSRLERLPGGMGIMFDDVGAGILAAGVVLALRWFGVLA